MITTIPDSWKGPARRLGALSTLGPACLTCLALLIMTAPGSTVSPSQSDDQARRAIDLLPGAADLKGWVPSGRPEVYQGEALYEYIDGGAEIYREYGFREVAVQDYKNHAGHTVTLEVYSMASPAAAYGICAFKTTGEGRPIGWAGVEGEIEDYYLNLWRGSVLVTATGLDEHPETLEGLISLGQATAARLSGSLEKPALVQSLPPEGLRPGSTKYFRGRLGFMNSRALFPGLAFPVREGARGLYNDGAELLVFASESSAEAAAVMAVIQTAARKDERFKDVRVEGEGFTARDGAGALTTRLTGRFVLLALASRADRARELKDLAARRVAARRPAP